MGGSIRVTIDIYEYDLLADVVDRNYRTYMAQPKRDGTKRKEVGFRWHDTNCSTRTTTVGRTTGNP